MQYIIKWAEIPMKEKRGIQERCMQQKATVAKHLRDSTLDRQRKIHNRQTKRGRSTLFLLKFEIKHTRCWNFINLKV